MDPYNPRSEGEARHTDEEPDPYPRNGLRHSSGAPMGQYGDAAIHAPMAGDGVELHFQRPEDPRVLSRREVLRRAEDAVLVGDYQKAIEVYTDALDEDRLDSFYIGRAHAHLKLEDFTDAILDCDEAILLDTDQSKAYYLKGMACFHLGEYQEALNTFKKGRQHGAEERWFDQWIVWTEERIKKRQLSQASAGAQAAGGHDSEDLNAEAQGSGVDGGEVAGAHGSGEHVEGDLGSATQKTGKQVDGSCVDVAQGAGEQTAAARPHGDLASEVQDQAKPKIRHDWYQTTSDVCVTILARNLPPDQVKVEFRPHSVFVYAPTADYTLELSLAQRIRPELSSFKVGKVKLELRLAKADAMMWRNLEEERKLEEATAKKKDWDKLETQLKKEEEEEKLEGDAALNQLFQKIYLEGNEEVRRAMNKSFVESGGTVLSTNWTEVKKDKVDVKPPDGMEWKKWEQ